MARAEEMAVLKIFTGTSPISASQGYLIEKKAASSKTIGDEVSRCPREVATDLFYGRSRSVWNGTILEPLLFCLLFLQLPFPRFLLRKIFFSSLCILLRETLLYECR